MTSPTIFHRNCHHRTARPGHWNPLSPIFFPCTLFPPACDSDLFFPVLCRQRSLKESRPNERIRKVIHEGSENRRISETLCPYSRLCLHFQRAVRMKKRNLIPDLLIRCHRKISQLHFLKLRVSYSNHLPSFLTFLESVARISVDRGEVGVEEGRK